MLSFSLRFTKSLRRTIVFISTLAHPLHFRVASFFLTLSILAKVRLLRPGDFEVPVGILKPLCQPNRSLVLPRCMKNNNPKNGAARMKNDSANLLSKVSRWARMRKNEFGWSRLQLWLPSSRVAVESSTITAHACKCGPHPHFDYS